MRVQLADALGEFDDLAPDPVVEILRNSAPLEDPDGHPAWPDLARQPEDLEATGVPSAKQPRGVQFPQQKNSRLKPSHAEVESRIAQLQLWIAQRQPKRFISEKAFELWGMTSSYTLRKYIKVARSRMAQELVTDRSLHIAEQIFALMDVARRAADAEQFSAAVGAHRVVCEISGMLRAPIKPPGEVA
ncbi:hypothetical protein KBY93_12260 [Synechococcus sp. J7-Johnson]|uniref:hypothetical protein n=1 Tax=Synechococcus sp. J7-Johnson TaxID=2823737 RepID=UPI0020CE43B5|nr:hypothetical protein [Synechococcus sp. J7-Johnson]MCP9841400.1 hypothetical protein [Synechococcus sp. J7-Johnson]